MAASPPSHPVPYVRHSCSASSAPALQQPNSGWELFQSTSSEGSSNTNTNIPSGLKEAFASSDGNQPNGISSNNQEPNVNQDRITSMFRASRHKGNVETASLFQATPPSRPQSAIRGGRPSTAMPRLSGQTQPAEGAIMTSIFSINKLSYDVHMFDNRITWIPVTQKKQRRSSFGNSTKKLSTIETGVLYLHDICSVKLKNVKSVSSGSTTTIGFAVFLAQQRSGNKFREKCMVFLCFSRDICIQWATRIKRYIQDNFRRPKRLLVLSSGTMAASQMWDDVVEPKLDMACVKSKYVDIDEADSASEKVQNLISEPSSGPAGESYDGLLVIGKVNLFSEVLNLLVKYKESASDGGTRNLNLPPVGFVPTSTASFISNEIHGTSDAETAVFHVIFGCTRDMPVCEFYDQDGTLLRYGLAASYGFSGGDTVRESSSRGFAAVQGSIKKSFAITKAIMKRRSYACQIQYKDGFSSDFPLPEDELYTRVKAKQHSMVNEHFVKDEQEKHFESKERRKTSDMKDSDSGIWPKNDMWNNIPRDNFVDITVTSLPQYDEAVSDDCPLSAILLRDSTSRKDLFLGMGSQVSLSSTMSKHKAEAQSKTDVLHGSEFVVKPVSDYTTNSTASNGMNHLSTWTVDGCCLNSSVQELHARVHDAPVLLYGRAPYQPLTLPPTQNVLNLEENNEDVTLDSLA